MAFASVRVDEHDRIVDRRVVHHGFVFHLESGGQNFDEKIGVSDDPLQLVDVTVPHVVEDLHRTAAADKTVIRAHACCCNSQP